MTVKLEKFYCLEGLPRENLISINESYMQAIELLFFHRTAQSAESCENVIFLITLHIKQQYFC